LLALLTLSRRCIDALSSLLSLVLTAFATVITLVSVIPAAVVVAASSSAAALHPPSMVGCCVTYSVVCHPIYHQLPSSSCNHQHFCRQPPSPIANLCQPLSYPSNLPLPSMVVAVFSARPAAYQLNHQAENVFMFPHLDLGL
jgi:hypothetical protein